MTTRSCTLCLLYAALLAGAAVNHQGNNDNHIGTSVLLPGKGADLASGTTITPTNIFHNVTGVSAISTITAPAGIQAGQLLILRPQGIFVIGTGGNVQIGVTSVVDKVLILVWDGAKWVPSYLL